jgi:hypothetical protein
MAVILMVAKQPEDLLFPAAVNRNNTKDLNANWANLAN